MTTLSGSDGQGPRATLPFDSNRFVTQLQHQGFSAEQSEAVLDALKSTMKEALDVQDGMLATKSEHVQLKSELTDRVFNSTLKFDIAQRHMRDLLERDFNNLKQDIRMIEKNDFDKVRNEIVDMEKRFLLQKQITDRMVHKLHLANETMETMIMKFSLSHLDGEGDSYSERVHVVSQLQRHGRNEACLRKNLIEMVGYSAVQAQGLVDTMKTAFTDSIEVQQAVVRCSMPVHFRKLTTDIAQRNMRDFLEHDFVTLKQDIHMMEKLDFEAVRNEIAQVEAKFKVQKEASDEMFDNLVKSNARLKKRVLNYVVAFGSTIAIILGVLGSIIDKH
ncbi:hypothetical protein DYB32_002869 [Aphanomyces invadans]|uniref:DUF1640 domain-containing protein n=1 Tax=Aphanomyces invadans TaxID=157072 RepID=A0A418B213_9STRA|nr:hypothetical protein DYB32_002869 [Aphanomyces invadans]